MRFALTPEQEAFRDTARRFLTDRVRLREQIAQPGAHDETLWKSIVKMGWLDGDGMTFVETALLAEEAGRALLPGPFTGTLIVNECVRRAGADGSTDPATAALDATGVRFVRNRLRGTIGAVPCAEVARLILVVAHSSNDRAAFLVNTAEATIETVESADLTRPAARVTFDGAKTTQRFEAASLGAMLDRARVLTAADAVGGAAKALEMAVAYAKERVQFDRPIGSFQAVKHRAADGWRALESARLATWYAAWAIESGADDATTAARSAKAMAGDAFVRCAADSIQIHGGIGFTWEHDAHLYDRRALADQAVLGDATAHRDAIAADVFARA